MLNVTVHVMTRTPVERVFAFVADGYFENHAKWDPAIIGMIRDPRHPVGKGTTGTEIRRFISKQKAVFEVTEFDRPHLFALRNTTGPWELERSYAFWPAGDNTEITFDFRMKPNGGAARALLPLIRGTIARQVRTNIERLPALLDVG